MRLTGSSQKGERDSRQVGNPHQVGWTAGVARAIADEQRSVVVGAAGAGRVHQVDASGRLTRP